MSALEIKTHDELSIEPEPIISPEDIHAVPDEAWKRGHEFSVYRVPSSSQGGNYTVVHNDKTRVLYCTCLAGQHGTICRHLKSVVFKRAYEQAYRLYADLSLPELQEREREIIEIERGALVQVRAWRAINGAIADLVRERLEGAA